MNGAVFIAQNEILNLCQSLQAKFGLTYHELILTLGSVTGQLAQAEYIQTAYNLAAAKAAEAKKPEEE